MSFRWSTFEINASVSFLYIKSCFIKKYTFIFPGDILEMKFQFHKAPEAMIKFWLIQCPTCHWLNSSVKLPGVRPLPVNALKYIVHSVYLSMLPGILNIYLLNLSLKFYFKSTEDKEFVSNIFITHHSALL